MIRQRLTRRPLDRNGRRDLIAAAVRLLYKLQLHLEARRFIRTHNHRSVALYAVQGPHPQRVLATHDVGGQREVGLRHAALLFDLALQGHGALGADQLHKHAGGLGIGGQRPRRQVPHLQPNRLARLIQRLVGLDMHPPTDVALEVGVDLLGQLRQRQLAV